MSGRHDAFLEATTRWRLLLLIHKVSNVESGLVGTSRLLHLQISKITKQQKTLYG